MRGEAPFRKKVPLPMQSSSARPQSVSGLELFPILFVQFAGLAHVDGHFTLGELFRIQHNDFALGIFGLKDLLGGLVRRGVVELFHAQLGNLGTHQVTDELVGVFLVLGPGGDGEVVEPDHHPFFGHDEFEVGVFLHGDEGVAVPRQPGHH